LRAQSRTAAMPGQPVSGMIISSTGQPVPGLTVKLHHPELGDSVPAVTSPAGFYYFGYVPSQVQAPYTIEVYWGQRLIYRDYVRRLGEQETIRLD
jgi:hypothetical protein